jgi:DNA-binding NtrC family response regulator
VVFEVGTPLVEMEREMIIRTLSIAQNNRKRTAELLGISRRALYGKLHKHGIE